MENKKSNILYNLNKELEKYKKASKIIKKDFINDYIINSLVSLRKNHLEVTKMLENIPVIEDFDDFITQYDRFQEFFDKFKNCNIKDITTIKFKNDLKNPMTIQAVVAHLTFIYNIKYKTPFFLELQYYFPNFFELNLNEIIFWILNVKLLEKQNKKNSNYFFLYVKAIQNKKNDEDIKELLIFLFNKLIKQVKYGKK